MKPIFVGDTVDVHHGSVGKPWPCVVRALRERDGVLDLILIRLPEGNELWFSADDGRARGGWFLAAKHVPACAGVA